MKKIILMILLLSSINILQSSEAKPEAKPEKKEEQEISESNPISIAVSWYNKYAKDATASEKDILANYIKELYEDLILGLNKNYDQEKLIDEIHNYIEAMPQNLQDAADNLIKINNFKIGTNKNFIILDILLKLMKKENLLEEIKKFEVRVYKKIYST